MGEFIDAEQRLKEIRERAENPDIHFPQIVKRDMKWLCDYAEELQNRLFNLAVTHSQLKYDEALKKTSRFMKHNQVSQTLANYKTLRVYGRTRINDQ